MVARDPIFIPSVHSGVSYMFLDSLSQSSSGPAISAPRFPLHAVVPHRSHMRVEQQAYFEGWENWSLAFTRSILTTGTSNKHTLSLLVEGVGDTTWEVDVRDPLPTRPDAKIFACDATGPGSAVRQDWNWMMTYKCGATRVS